MTISVVIPTLNEASLIEATLASVAVQTPPWEVLVVDGGSTDETIAQARPRAIVLQADRGRAPQMNRGWQAARGDAVLFLHADTVLPRDAFDRIRQVLEDSSAEGGAFRLKFDTPGFLLNFYARCTALEWPCICFGDRGLFVRRWVLEAMGGIPEMPIFEDLQFVRLLNRRGGFRFVPVAVTTAARRFVRQGALRQQIRNVLLWTGYWLGTDPHILSRYYPSHG